MVSTSDTSAAARRHMDDLLRRMTPEQKLRRVLALNEVARSLTLVRMRAEEPGQSDAALRRRLAIDLLPPDLARIMRGRNPR